MSQHHGTQQTLEWSTLHPPPKSTIYNQQHNPQCITQCPLLQVGELSLQRFATTEAVQCTEVWEFVQRLGDPSFSMPTLQPYKYMHAVRLVEAGLATVAQVWVWLKLIINGILAT